MYSLTVVYLLRKDKYFEENLDSFLSSLRGTVFLPSCTLLFLFKGFNHFEVDDIKNLKNINEYNHMLVDDHLFDLNSYIECANRNECRFFLFLNSYSFLNCSNWNDIYLSAKQDLDSVIIGSSASYEVLGYNSPLLYNHNLLSIVKWICRILIRKIFSLRFLFSITTYPNPHIRTNAFLIDRKSFLDYFQLNGYPRSKFHCHQVESGANGLTKFMIKKGAKVAIVSNKGEVFNVNQWGSANLFRTNLSADRLIVTDNRTREFDVASSEKKARLSWDSWRV